MNSSARETLHSTINLLSDKEARQVLKFAQHLQKKEAVSQTLKRLAQDAAFSVPAETSKRFPIVNPIQGKGLAASSLLVKDRQ
jgi:hypothetical protein